MNIDPEKVKALFNQALSLRRGERAAFLAEACAGDEELRQRVQLFLDAQKVVGDTPLPAGPMAKPNPTLAISMPFEEMTEQSGDRIGHYKLLQPLGEGGTGIEWYGGTRWLLQPGSHLRGPQTA